MAQFDVYANPQVNSRRLVPYVIDMQSRFIDSLPTRLVMPLSRIGAGLTKQPTNLCPVVEIESERLAAMPHLAAPVLASALKKPITSVAHRAGDLIAAVDAVFAGL